MNALKAVLVVIAVLCLGLIAGCNEGHSRQDGMMGDSMMEMDKVVWQQGLTGFPHPVVLHP